MVLSFPIPLRYWLHPNTKHFSRIHSEFGYFEKVPLAKGKRCFSVNGLKAFTAILRRFGWLSIELNIM